MNIRYLVAITLIIGFQNVFSAVLSPTLVSPVDNYITIENSAEFIWNKAVNASSYTFQLSQDSIFTNIFFQATTNDNRITTSLSLHNKLFWRVKNSSLNADSTWSSVWSIEHFNPSSINDMSLWLKTDSGVIEINNNVQVWNDFSIFNNNATQSNPAYQPVLGNNIATLNSHKSVEFDGSDDLLSIPHNSSLNLGLNSTIFYVGNFKSTSSNGGVLTKRDPPNLSGIELLKSGSNLVFVHKQASPAGNVNITVPYPSGYNIINLYRKDENAVYRINGDLGSFSVGPSNTNVNVNCSAPLYIGSNRTLSAFFLGDLCEIVVFNSALENHEIAKIEDYLRYKYAPPVNLGEDTVVDYGFCANIKLDASDRFTTYNWSNGSTSNSIIVNSGGVYSVTVTDVFGFESSDSIVVHTPSYKYPEKTVFCKNDSILWDTELPNTYNFEWSTGETSSSIYISTPGAYWVKISDSTNNGNCFILSDTVNVQEDPFQSIASLGNDRSLCSGNEIGLILGDSLAKTFYWSTSDTTPKITIIVSGDYSLSATSYSDCIFEDTVSILVSGSSSIVDFQQFGTCVGTEISFSNLSIPGSGDTINTFLWDFGDGDSSTLENPTHVFSSSPSSSYDVELKIFTTAGCSFSTIKTIPIIRNPISYFSDSIGCEGVQKTFSSLSTYFGLDSIVNYNWDFGDNSTSQLENPIKTYFNENLYNVDLIVETVNGCVDTFTRQVNIFPSTPPLNSFTLVSPANGIIGLRADTFNLIWNEAFDAIYYIVEFSSDPSFNNIYYSSQALDTTQFLYIDNSLNNEVYWRVLAYNRCGRATSSNIRSIKFFIAPPNNSLWLMADRNVSTQGLFVNEWKDNSANNNNAIQTTASNRPLLKTEPLINNKKTLEFGGNEYLTVANSTSLQFSLEYAFIAVMKSDSTIPSQGLFAKRPANGNDGIEFVYSSNKDLISINRGGGINMNIESEFFSGYNMLRLNRLNSQFSIFLNSDLLSSNNSNPISGINTSNSENLQLGTNRSISNFFIGDFAEIFMFDKSLTNSEAEYIEDYLNDKYAPPVCLGSDINIDYGVCLNVTLDASDIYTHYKWSTGDSTSSIQINQSGTYSVTVSNIFNRISSDTINVNIPSTSQPLNSGICLNDSLNWNISLNKSLYDFSWSNGSADSFIYMSEADTYWVEIRDTNNCILRDTFITSIDSFEIILDLGADTSLCSGNPIGVYQSGIYPISSYQWYPSGTSPSIITNQTGYYSLTARNSNGCVAVDSIYVDISGVAPNVSFSVENTCLGSNTEFNDLTNVSNANIISWHWDFGDLHTSTDQNPKHIYDATGNYTVQLNLVTDSGCTGAFSNVISIKPRPTANFIHNLTCSGQAVQFQELSAPPFGSFITDRFWDFGNGETANVQNPVVFFDSSGTYDVALYSSAANACFDTIVRSVEVYPAIDPKIEAENLCIGNDVQFYDASPNYSNIDWLWEFGDGEFSFSENPKHSYLLPGQYSVSLTVTNALRCKETVSKLITIAEKPQLDFFVESSCPGVPAQFNDLTQLVLGDSIISYVWDFGDSSNISRLKSPFHIFKNTGTYAVNLNVKTKFGCIANYSEVISIVEGPKAAFNLSPNFGGAPLHVEFTNQSTGASRYFWSFDDNSEIETSTNVSHTFENEGEYEVYLVAMSTEGCTDTAYNDLYVTDALYDILLLELNTARFVNPDCSYHLKSSVQFANQGTLPIKSIRFSLSLDGKTTISEIWEGDLQPGAINVYEFKSQVNILECEAQYYLCVEATYLDGGLDQTPVDNNTCVSELSSLVVGNLYPNPTKDVLSLNLIAPIKADVAIQLVDYKGQVISQLIEQELMTGYTHFDFDVSLLRPGTYILNIKYREEDVSKKFVIVN